MVKFDLHFGPGLIMFAHKLKFASTRLVVIIRNSKSENERFNESGMQNMHASKLKKSYANKN